MVYHLRGATCVFVCSLMCVCFLMYACVSVHNVVVCVCAHIKFLIISLQVNKEKKITSLIHYKVDVGCAARALKVGVSQWYLINQIRLPRSSFNLQEPHNRSDHCRISTPKPHLKKAARGQMRSSHH